jgi:hypothetical protein
VRQSRAVQIVDRNSVGGEKGFLAIEFPLREFGRGAVLTKPRFEGGKLGRTRALPEILETSLSRAQAIRRFVLCGEISLMFQREQRITRGDPRPFLYRECFELPAERSSDLDKFAFEVALIPARRGTMAT